jgi:hypothetical protein
MPQLDQFAFLSHVSSTYFILIVVTLFLIRWIMPKIFSIFRLRFHLVTDQHPGIVKVSSLAIWTKKRQWVSIMCNWREIRLFPDFNSNQFWNLQSFLRLLYHSYWKNLSINSLYENSIISNLYAIRLHYLSYLVKIGPEKARFHYRNAITKLISNDSDILDIKCMYWKNYFSSISNIKSYTQLSYYIISTYANRLFFILNQENNLINVPNKFTNQTFVNCSHIFLYKIYMFFNTVRNNNKDGSTYFNIKYALSIFISDELLQNTILKWEWEDFIVPAIMLAIMGILYYLDRRNQQRKPDEKIPEEKNILLAVLLRLISRNKRSM